MKLDQIRNIGIIAHIDAGKTTTTERILFYTGRVHKIGEVHYGTATTDFDEEERDRGITIYSAATTCEWRDYTINLIDTPGHVDFTAEVERSLRVLDGAVGVFDGVAGVEAQSETVWRQADRYNVPRIAYINKLDRMGADFDRCLASLRERLKARPCPLVIPVGKESELSGLIHLVTGKLLTFGGDEGQKVVENDIPEEELTRYEMYREQMLEACSDVDSDVMEAYLEGAPILPEQLYAALRKGTIAGDFLPVLCGSSLKNLGVQPVLDAVVELLPSPLDVESPHGTHPKTGDDEVRQPEDSEPMSALAFKTTTDRHGELTYLRVYSGKLKVKDQIYNPREDKKERPSRMFRMFADSREAIDEAGPGEIVAVLGLKFTVTGDTLCAINKPVFFERMQFPETVVSVAMEPKSSSDRDKMIETLAALAKDDPTFRTHTDDETGQLIVSGMGELHIEVIQHKMQRDFNVKVNTGAPRVSYKETVLGPGEGDSTYAKTIGEKNVFGHAIVRVSPSSELSPVVENLLPKKGGIPYDFQEGMMDQLRGEVGGSGGLAGFPLINVKVSLADAHLHETDMSPTAYNAAASQAFREAVRAAGTDILEPIMKIEIVVTEEHVGDILHDLNRRRAHIEEMVDQEGTKIVRGTVPIAEMFGYASQIRSLSGGRASYSLEPFDYAPLDPAKKEAMFGGIL